MDSSTSKQVLSETPCLRGEAGTPWVCCGPSGANLIEAFSQIVVDFTGFWSLFFIGISMGFELNEHKP